MLPNKQRLLPDEQHLERIVFVWPTYNELFCSSIFFTSRRGVHSFYCIIVLMQSSTTHKALLEQYRALGYNCAMLNLLPPTDSVIVTEMINEIDLNIASLTSAVGHQLDIPASQQAYAQGYAFVYGHLPMETPSKERPEGNVCMCTNVTPMLILKRPKVGIFFARPTMKKNDILGHKPIVFLAENYIFD